MSSKPFSIREADDWQLSADVSAYLFTANADAWKRFCRELSIDPDVLTAANYRGWLLQFCQERMPAHAPTAEALRARFQERGREDPQLVAADDLLTSWRKLLRGASCETPSCTGEERR